MKIRIAHITTSHKSNDTRIFHKQCLSLASKYEVYLISLDALRGKDYPNINFLPIKRNRRKFGRIFSSQIKIINLVLKNKIKLVHLHDPELIISGIIFKILGLKVIFDIHENYSRKSYNKNTLKGFSLAVLKKIYLFLESVSQYIFDALVTVNDDIKNKFTTNNVHIVRNYPKLKNFEKRERNKVVYIGDINNERGFEYFDFINDLAQEYGLRFEIYGRWNNPTRDYYKGYLEYEELDSCLQNSLLGLCILKQNDNYINAVPTKLYEYLINGVPTICSGFAKIKEKFKGNEGLIFVDPNDIEKTKEQIENIFLKNSELYEIGNKARKHFLSLSYTWSNEEKKLNKLYSDLLIENINS